MERTPEFRVAVNAWEDVAQRMLDVALAIAPLTEQQLNQPDPETEPPPSAEQTAAALVQAADSVFSFLADPLAAEDDDAVRAMYAFIAGNASMADALVTAADSPEAIVASLRLEHIGDIEYQPADAWRHDIAEAVQALQGQEPVRGGAHDEIPELTEVLDELIGDCGDELVAIGRDTVLAVALPQVAGALAAVLSGSPAKDFATIRAGVHVGWAAVRSAATKVMNWVTTHVTHVVPAWMQPNLTAAADTVKACLLQNPGRPVGLLAARVLGLGATRQAWLAAPEATRATASLGVAKATADELDLVHKVTRVRSFADHFARWLISIMAKVPAVVLAIAALAAAAMVLVLGVLWHGLRDLKNLV